MKFLALLLSFCVLAVILLACFSFGKAVSKGVDNILNGGKD